MKRLAIPIATLASVLLAAGAHGATGTVVLKTIGSTHLLPQTLRCPVELARVHIRVQTNGLRRVERRAHSTSELGIATFCVHSRVEVGNGRTTIGSGLVTIVLPDGTIEAGFTETESQRADGTASYSAVARDKSATGAYHGAAAVIVTTGLVRPVSARREWRQLTLRLELG
jgi:hypothetical protein